MARPPRRRPLLRVLVALTLAATAALELAPGPAPPSAAALSRWTGGVDLYRPGVFTTQKTWLWCTAADVQIIRNIVDRQADHSRSAQSRYFDYMRAHDRYRIPVSDGTEPSGWTAGLRHYVDGRYRLVQSTSFNAALRSAVTNLRKTNLPVGLLVAHGDHAWVLTGFSATADPARTSHFTVTSVRVTGPLWGLQSRSFGYDMRPDTRLTPAQLRGFFTPWHYARIRMAWEGRWVSIQGIPGTVAKSPATPKSPATRTPTPKPKAIQPAPATPRPTPEATQTPRATPSVPAVPAATATATATPAVAALVAQPSAAPPATAGPVVDSRPAVWILLVLGLLIATLLGLARILRRRSRDMTMAR
jgi:hypothetical protein